MAKPHEGLLARVCVDTYMPTPCGGLGRGLRRSQKEFFDMLEPQKLEIDWTALTPFQGRVLVHQTIRREGESWPPQSATRRSKAPKFRSMRPLRTPRRTC